MKKDKDVNLAYAALLIAECLSGPVDNSLYLALLDDIAATVEPAITQATSDEAILQALNHHFFTELKFSGTVKNYYHPENSFLNRVLDLRQGIPISLSAIYLEVGWRLGLPLWGINLPGHFIVGYGPVVAPIYIDVFGQGRFLREDECVAIAQERLSNPQQIKERYLKPAGKKTILFRMLMNLKQIYVGLENWELAYRVVDLMLTIGPVQPSEYRDRGLIAYRLNRLRGAIRDIERYLFLVPHSPDAAWLKQHLETMEEKLLRLN